MLSHPCCIACVYTGIQCRSFEIEVFHDPPKKRSLLISLRFTAVEKVGGEEGDPDEVAVAVNSKKDESKGATSRDGEGEPDIQLGSKTSNDKAEESDEPEKTAEKSQVKKSERSISQGDKKAKNTSRTPNDKNKESVDLTAQKALMPSGSSWKAPSQDIEVEDAAEQMGDIQVAASAAARQDRLRERRRRRRRDRQVLY